VGLCLVEVNGRWLFQCECLDDAQGEGRFCFWRKAPTNRTRL